MGARSASAGANREAVDWIRGSGCMSGQPRREEGRAGQSRPGHQIGPQVEGLHLKQKVRKVSKKDRRTKKKEGEDNKNKPDRD